MRRPNILILCMDQWQTNVWTMSGVLQHLADMRSNIPGHPVDHRAALRAAGRKFGAPDFSKRTFYRALVDGHYKLVRWFSPEDYGNPSTIDELYAQADVTLHDLQGDPGEMENLAHPRHPRHDREQVTHALGKLHALVAHEIGDDVAPFDLNLFGTHEPRCGPRSEHHEHLGT